VCEQALSSQQQYISQAKAALKNIAFEQNRWHKQAVVVLALKAESNSVWRVPFAHSNNITKAKDMGASV